jgi:hypothetical protein
MSSMASTRSESLGDGQATDGIYNNRVMVRGSELKYTAARLDTWFPSIPTGVINYDIPSLIASGATISTRIGRSIFATDLAINGVLAGGQTNTVADDAHNSVRIAVVSALTGLTWSAGTFNLSTILDPRQMVGLDHVYFDKVFTLVSPGRDSTGYLPALMNVCERIKIQRKFNYASDAATVCSPNDLYLIACSDSSVVPHPGFISGSFVFYFTDK